MYTEIQSRTTETGMDDIESKLRGTDSKSGNIETESVDIETKSDDTETKHESTEIKSLHKPKEKSKCCECWAIINENEKVKRTKEVIKFIIKPIAVVLLYYADIITDIILAASYLRDQHYFWFSLTAFFIVVPWLAGFVVYYKSIINGGEGGINVETRWGQMICSAIAPVYAQMKIYITYKTQEEEDDDPGFDNYNMEEESKLDETLVQIIESFTESAPQLLLQMYITMKAIHDPSLENEGLERNISMAFAWIKIAYSLTARESARINWLRSKAVQSQLTRQYREDKDVMLRLKLGGKKQYNEFPFLAIVLHMSMRTVEIAQRIIALGFIAATPQFFLPVMISLVVHWIVVFAFELIVTVVRYRKQASASSGNTMLKEDGDSYELLFQGEKNKNKRSIAYSKPENADDDRIISESLDEGERMTDLVYTRSMSREVGDVGFASEDEGEDGQSIWIAMILVIVKASILLFCHENQTKQRNIWKMVIFYSIFFIENTVAVVVWLQYTPLYHMWFYEPVFYFFVTAPVTHVVLHIIIEHFFMERKDRTHETIEGDERPGTTDKQSGFTVVDEQNGESSVTLQLLGANKFD